MNHQDQWRVFESVAQRGLFGVESSDKSLIESGDEIVVPPRMSRNDAEAIVQAHNSIPGPGQSTGD